MVWALFVHCSHAMPCEGVQFSLVFLMFGKVRKVASSFSFLHNCMIVHVNCASYGVYLTYFYRGSQFFLWWSFVCFLKNFVGLLWIIYYVALGLNGFLKSVYCWIFFKVLYEFYLDVWVMWSILKCVCQFLR